MSLLLEKFSHLGECQENELLYFHGLFEAEKMKSQMFLIHLRTALRAVSVEQAVDKSLNFMRVAVKLAQALYTHEVMN